MAAEQARLDALPLPARPGLLQQPAWSAFRSASFGHGEFELLNNTHAHFTWHENKDGEPVVSDEYYVVNTQAQ